MSLAYCTNSNRYATGHSNGEINIWSVGSNEHLDQLRSHNGRVRTLAFDRMGKLFSGGSDGHIRIWNLSETGSDPKELEVHFKDDHPLHLKGFVIDVGGNVKKEIGFPPEQDYLSIPLHGIQSGIYFLSIPSKSVVRSKAFLIP